MASQDDVFQHFNLTMEESSRADRLVGTILFMISFVGLLVDVCVVFYISRRPSAQNSFGVLSRNQCFGDMISCFLSTFQFAPMVYFNIHKWQTAQVTQWFGFVQLMCYDAGNMTHFFASINRLTAIFFPNSYRDYFTMRTAYVLNISSWIIVVVPGFFFYVLVDCHVIYDKLYWKYEFSPEEAVCTSIGFHYDFVRSCVLVSSILTMDLFTYTKARFIRKKMVQSISDQKVSDQKAHAMKLNEINFVTQACLQGLFFGVDLVSWFLITPFLTNRWLIFVFTQFTWVLLTTLDGTMALVFNKEFREWASKNF